MSELIITNKKYVYLKIPTKYILIYHQLCELMVDFGEDMLKDCKANCAARNVEVQKCFNMFQAALMARELGKYKHEETLIKYIKAKLKTFDKTIHKDEFTITLEDGLTGYVSVEDGEPVIRIDPSEVPDTEKILYCVIKPTNYTGYNNHQEFADKHIIEENILSKTVLDIKSGIYDYECSLDEGKLMLAVLVPVDKSANVKVDNGFGKQVDFGSSGLWYSNGEVTIQLDSIEYKVYGELYPISADVKFYITLV